MRHKINIWETLGAPQNIISTLSGYRIPFVKRPPLIRFDKRFCSNYQTAPSHAMTQEINKMIESGAVKKCKAPSGFLSTLFLRKKSDGTMRPIFDLRNINFYLRPCRFRLLNHFKVPLNLKQSDFMTKIDLSQAYFHIPVVQAHRRFLAFAYRNVVYEMTCLPFGLATAPYAFANVSNWLANLFRKEGIRIIVYLDDFLIMHSDPYVLEQQTQEILHCLQDLGWCINLEKSVLTPTRVMEYLGIVWNTDLNLKYLPNLKTSKISSIIKDTLGKGHWTWQVAKVILGHLNFAMFTVPLGRLHSRQIQIHANTLPERERNKRFHLPKSVTCELRWWLNHEEQSSPLHEKEPTIFITTDASDLGWGATVNDLKMNGEWTTEQVMWHSNRKELWTLKRVFDEFAQDFSHRTVLAQTDNRTVAAYITKEGGTKSQNLLQLTTDILLQAHHHQIHLIARYLPGRYNITADSLSRFQPPPEWTLSHQIIKIIFKKLGTPSIDLFASEQSAVVEQYVTENARDLKCAFVNAFSRTWHYKVGWIFPPPSLIPRVLRHLEKSSGVYLFVVPKWEKAFWFHELKQKAIHPPFTIRNLDKHLTDLRTGKPPPAVEKINLQVWKVRAGPPYYKHGMERLKNF